MVVITQELIESQKRTIDNFIVNLERQGCGQTELEAVLHEIHYALTGKTTRRDDYSVPYKVLSRSQAVAMLDLAKASLDYLSFHHDAQRTGFYKVFSSHGKAGEERALNVLNILAAYAYGDSDVPVAVNISSSSGSDSSEDDLLSLVSEDRNISDMSDEGINALRDRLIEKAHSLFKVKHSLQTFLEKTSPAETQRPASMMSND